MGYLYDLSEKRMCEEVAMHGGLRRFCDLDFSSPVPDRTMLVKLRRHTWGEKVFRQVMEAIVGQCIETGLVKGKAAAVDGYHVRARAAATSLEAIEPVQSIEEYCTRLAQEDPPHAAAQQKPPDNDPSNGGSGTAHSLRCGEALDPGRCPGRIPVSAASWLGERWSAGLRPPLAPRRSGLHAHLSVENRHERLAAGGHKDRWFDRPAAPWAKNLGANDLG